MSKRICEICGKEFRGLAALFDHKRIHPEWVKGMTNTIRLWEKGEK